MDYCGFLFLSCIGSSSARDQGYSNTGSKANLFSSVIEVRRPTSCGVMEDFLRLTTGPTTLNPVACLRMHPGERGRPCKTRKGKSESLLPLACRSERPLPNKQTIEKEIRWTSISLEVRKLLENFLIRGGISFLRLMQKRSSTRTST